MASNYQDVKMKKLEVTKDIVLTMIAKSSNTTTPNSNTSVVAEAFQNVWEAVDKAVDG